MSHFGYFSTSWQQGMGPLFSSFNPATGEAVWHGQAANAQQVDQCVKEARQAFKKWSSLSIDLRAIYLEKFASILKERLDSLAVVISKETGKPLWESKGEIQSMINKVALSLEAYGSRCANMIRETPQGSSITRHRPHGILGVLGPFNFPGHLPNGHIIPALLAGNVVIFKPSELTPLVAEEMVKCWEATDLPSGTLNLVQGGPETGQALIKNPDIDGLLFTGSYKTGRMLSEAFASTPQKILALEMGGNNPLIIGEISNLQAAAYMTIQSAYLTSGQRCTCARRLIIPKGSKGDSFLEVLSEMVQKIRIGPYTDQPEPYMGPVTAERMALAILRSQSQLQEMGGIPLLLSKHLRGGTGFLTPGLMDVTSIKEKPDEEIFGPFLQVVRVDDLQEALAEANRTRYGLSAGILTEQEAEYHHFYQEIQAGIVNWNTPLTGASSAAPFGGVGCSGNNRPSAYYAADYCAYPVASLEINTLKLPSALPPGLQIG